MTIAHFATGAKSAGGITTISVPLPAPTAAGVMCLAGRSMWISPAALAETGWTHTADLAGGQFSAAVDDHLSRIRVDRRELRGTELGSVVFDQSSTSGDDGALGIMVAYSRTGAGWDIVAGTGTDNTHGVNRSALCSTSFPLAPGDVVVALVAVDTDTDLAGFAAPAITAPGITFGATTRRTSGAGVTTGMDGNIEVLDATVTAGTATLAPTLAFTTTTPQCGPVAFVRLREIPTRVSGWRPTTAALLDLRDIPRRFDDFRFEVVDRLNHKIGEVQPDLDRNPTVTWDTQRAVQRSLDSFYLPASVQNEINPHTDRIRPVMVLQNGAEFNLGVFLWTDSQRPHRSWGLEREGTLLDRTFVLDQPGPWPQSVPKDRTVLQWVTGYLEWFPEFRGIYDITPGYADNWEAATLLHHIVQFGEEMTSRIFRAPVTWSAGTTTLRMFNDVMSLVNYLPVYCTRDGMLTFKAAPSLDTSPATLFYSHSSGRMIEESIVESDDLLTVPNMIFVYETSANSSMIWGVWHAPAEAPYSEANRGFRVSKVVPMTGLANNDEATQVAHRISEWSIKAGSWIQWKGPADPRHDAFDILNIQGEKWLEVSWKLPCVTGQPMDHKALKVYAHVEPT
jgi:hypothetical protein